MTDPKTVPDQNRIKTQRADKEGVRNTTDDILTNPNADNLSQEDLHEKLDSSSIKTQPSGRGLLVGDGVEAQVSYRLRVTQETIRAGHYGDPGATIPGLQDIDGQVEFDDPMEEAGLVGRKLNLHLEDGRRLAVLIVGQGRIKGTGGFSKS
jgi:hypothetical protein